MWLATQHGFYSIVQKPAGKFHVRTRCRLDLENLIALAGLEASLHHTTDGDYAWRIIVGQKEVSSIMAALAIWIHGRHNRAEGFLADIEKYFEAALAGWTVIRLSERQLTLEIVERIVRFVNSASSDPVCPAQFNWSPDSHETGLAGKVIERDIPARR